MTTAMRGLCEETLGRAEWLYGRYLIECGDYVQGEGWQTQAIDHFSEARNLSVEEAAEQLYALEVAHVA